MPTDTPVTTAELVVPDTDATAGLELLHTPPVAPSESVMEEPTHTDDAPEMAPAVALLIEINTVAVLLQPAVLVPVTV
jgi:hypothetical protein